MSKHICVIAGEASGDFLGGNLIKALRERDPDLHFSGVGGRHMATAGVRSLFPYEALALMGIVEIFAKLHEVIPLFHQTVDHIVASKPDVVVTIDAPEFNFRLAKALRQKMPVPPKIIHYVAPSVWAWREGRAEKVSKFLDGLICLFDFEPPYFEKHDLACVAAGHPMVEGEAMHADGARFRDEYGILQGDTIIGALFGSRRGEVKRTGPAIRDALFKLADKMERLPHIVAPTLPHIEVDVRDLLKDYGGHLHVFTETDHKFDAFKAFNVAIAVSGTVGLELAALEVPHVIGYKMNPITAMIIKRMIKVKYAHLANIMADKEIVPEFIQHNCIPENMAEAAFQIFQNPAAQKAEFEAVKFRLGFTQEKTPSQKAAEFVLSFTK
jgi:lipid-A-disaccharide synthase